MSGFGPTEKPSEPASCRTLFLLKFYQESVDHPDISEPDIHQRPRNSSCSDREGPDRSALIFAPEPNGPDDILLQAREIRDLHIRAKLVTLSACDTGVRHVGEADVSTGVSELD